MYCLKEKFRDFWRRVTPEQASRFLDAWCEGAIASKTGPLMKVAKTLQMYRFGLMNYFKIGQLPLQSKKSITKSER